MGSRGVYRLLEPRVSNEEFYFSDEKTEVISVAEMLLAVLSVCSPEELEESSEESTDVSDGEGGKYTKAPVPQDISARRQQIKNKILAVGRLQRAFTVLRYVRLVGF
jgi:hypothetical protein